MRNQLKGLKGVPLDFLGQQTLSEYPGCGTNNAQIIGHTCVHTRTHILFWHRGSQPYFFPQIGSSCEASQSSALEANPLDRKLTLLNRRRRRELFFSIKSSEALAVQLQRSCFLSLLYMLHMAAMGPAFNKLRSKRNTEVRPAAFNGLRSSKWVHACCR